VETRPSITSAETRCVMGAATQAAEVIARNSVKLRKHGCHLAGRSSMPTTRHPEPALGQIRKPA
jgi:hypothetical protein